MPLLTKKYITRDFVKKNPSWLFVYEDSISGAMASEFKEEPNSAPIITSIDKGKPFKDDEEDLLEFSSRLKAFKELAEAVLTKNGVIIFPQDGIGRSMERISPTLYSLLTSTLTDIYAKSIIPKGNSCVGCSHHTKESKKGVVLARCNYLNKSDFDPDGTARFSLRIKSCGFNV